MDKVKQNRSIMKSGFNDWDEDTKSDQDLKLPQPPLQKPFDENIALISLNQPSKESMVKTDIFDIVQDRVSHRRYSDQSITLDELSWLLWATQGVKKVIGKNNYATLRTVPSGGARHPFETYLVVNRVEGLEKGVYRYLALTHQLQFLFSEDDLLSRLNEATLEQKFIGEGAVTFAWTCVAYRGEWRYREHAHKAMLLDAGHVCQNLYVAAEAVGCGTCAIAAYDQGKMDAFLRVDGFDEFTVYLAPVGKLINE